MYANDMQTLRQPVWQLYVCEPTLSFKHLQNQVMPVTLQGHEDLTK